MQDMKAPVGERVQKRFIRVVPRVIDMEKIGLFFRGEKFERRFDYTNVQNHEGTGKSRSGEVVPIDRKVKSQSTMT